MVFPIESDSDNYILEMERTIELLIAENYSLKEMNTSLSGEVEALKKRLLLYENPHTPPALQRFKPKPVNPEGKRGSPKGHKGTTRIHDKPDEIIHVSEDKCPECNHPLDSPIRTEKKTIFDIPPPQKIKITEFDLDVYKCNNCGIEVKSKHMDCPQVGDMGIYLLNYITMLKY
ncbi:MAG: IS66 family transposase zinc-finger binding domain-containing protein, partial [Cuniculiplasma sp.]